MFYFALKLRLHGASYEGMATTCGGGSSQVEGEGVVDVFPGDFFVNLRCDAAFFHRGQQPLRQVTLVFGGAVIEGEE